MGFTCEAVYGRVIEGTNIGVFDIRLGGANSPVSYGRQSDNFT